MAKHSKMEAYLAQADALMGVGRWRDAITPLGRALAIEPQHYSALCVLSACYRHTGAFDEALRQAQKAIAAAPDFQRAYYQLAVTHIDRGDLDEALWGAREAYRKDPRGTCGILAMTLVLSSRDEWTEALKYACEHRELMPGDVKSYVNLSMVYLGLADWRKAEENGRIALKIEPGSASAMNNLAVALRHQRKYEEALKLFEQAARLDPANLTTKKNLADISRTLMNEGSPYVMPDGTPMTKSQRESRDMLFALAVIGGSLAVIVWAVYMTETVAGFALLMCGLFFVVGLPLLMLCVIWARYRNYQRLPASSRQLLRMVRKSDRPWLLGRIHQVPGVTIKSEHSNPSAES